MSYCNNKEPIEGTIMFDGQMAMKGYGLNKMCFTFNTAVGREAFTADEQAYCDKFNLSEIQKLAIKERDVLGLLKEGGSIYYLAKFIGILGLNMQDIGAIQRGISVEEFKQLLVDAGK